VVNLGAHRFWPSAWDLARKILDSILVFAILLMSASRDENERFFVYLVCTAKTAFASFWAFAVSVKSITYFLSESRFSLILNWGTVINPFSDGDLWVSTRASLADAWSLPQLLGPTVNTSYAEANPSLSCDGTELYFTSDRPGGIGGLDLWVSKRTPLVTEGP
jgi:WD40-like Beta Propeller Repeat